MRERYRNPRRAFAIRSSAFQNQPDHNILRTTFAAQSPQFFKRYEMKCERPGRAVSFQ